MHSQRSMQLFVVPQVRFHKAIILNGKLLARVVARIAVAREAQQVAMEQELLETLPTLYKNIPEQVTKVLECKGKGGQPCQGPANISITVRQPRLQTGNVFMQLRILF